MLMNAVINAVKMLGNGKPNNLIPLSFYDQF